MEQETLRSRIAQLIQKCRKAVRLYSGMDRLSSAEQSEYTSLQLEQWQNVNSDLLRVLSAAFDHPNSRLLNGELLSIRDRLCSDWRSLETELKTKQRELLLVSEKGDFVRAAILSRALVAVKAREQATQAAHHELLEVVGSAKSSSYNEETATPPLEPPAPNPTSDQKPPPRGARVIPLRTRLG